jgi:hypothetical protein
MPDERRYREEEVSEILDLASRDEALAAEAPSGRDLALSEIQDIGREVGLDPGDIARAAAVVDARTEVLPRRTSVGMPVSVGRIVELDRALTEGEWEALVSELRQTFDATGEVAPHGGIRRWANGNLEAFLEPYASGHRLRIRTRKGGAIALNWIGVASLALGLVLTALAGSSTNPPELVLPVLLLGTVGIGSLLWNWLRLPGWAQEREGQMEYIAETARGLQSKDPDEREPESQGS